MKTAAQVRKETDIAQDIFYIKAKDSIRNYLEREIFQASRRGEYKIKVNFDNLEGFVCISANANFTFQQITSEILAEMLALNYTVARTDTTANNVTISWKNNNTQG